MEGSGFENNYDITDFRSQEKERHIADKFSSMEVELSRLGSRVSHLDGLDIKFDCHMGDSYGEIGDSASDIDEEEGSASELEPGASEEAEESETDERTDAGDRPLIGGHIEYLSDEGSDDVNLVPEGSFSGQVQYGR